MNQPNKYSVIQIIDTLDAGGAERVLVTVSNILAANGHKVTVVTTLHKGILASELSEQVDCIELRRPSKWHLGSMKKLVAFCNEFDVVHVHSSHNLRYLYVAAKLFGLRKQIFFHEHFGNIDVDKRVHWHQQLIYPSTILIAVSKSLEQWAVQLLKMNKHKVHLLENIVVQKKVSINTSTTTSSAAYQLLLVSNFRRAKNIEFAIKLMSVLSTKLNVHLTIVGQPVDKLYVQEIEQLIQENNLQQCITLQHHCSAVQDILQQFHLAIHTATTESGPLVLIEYMAQQLPFITFNTGEVVQQIQEHLPNNILHHFQVADWVEKIYTMLTATPVKEQQKKLSELFNLYYSSEAYYQKLMSIYNAHNKSKTST